MKDRTILGFGSLFTIACFVLAVWDSRLHTVTLGDGEIRYKLAGDGKPVVILEAGLGMDLESFDPVFDDLATYTRVFAYDRPGYGESTPTARPRSVEQAVNDLRHLLNLAAIQPPYLLVGHSLGGIYMLEFAHRFPTETAGVVLVDAPNPDIHKRLGALGVESRISDKHYWGMPDHVRREYDGALAASLAGNLGDIPLIVITSGDVAHSAFGPMVRKTRVELLELSTNARSVYVEDSSHMMLDDVPETVIRCVLDVLDQARFLPEHVDYREENRQIGHTKPTGSALPVSSQQVETLEDGE